MATTATIRDAAVLRALCTKAGWHTYLPQILKVLWTSSVLQIAHSYLEELHKAVAHDFTPQEFRQYVVSVVGDEDRLAEIKGLLDSMESAPEISGDVLREAVNRCVSRNLSLQAAKDILTKVQKPDYDPSEPLKLLTQATDIVTVPDSAAVSDYLSSGMPDPEVDRPNKCSLYLGTKLDDALRGGPAAGEVVLFLAGPKKGKTSVIAHVGAKNALHAGKRVLDITLEISKELRMRRYDSSYTGMDYEGLVRHPQIVERARQSVADAGGSVTFVDWQYEEHSPSEILPIVAEYGPFDLLILDYLELMIPDRTKAYARREQRHLLSKLGKDIRGVAKRLALPVVTAWQVNRFGNQADQVTENDISECFDIVKHVDAIIGMSRSSEEKRQNLLRIHTTDAIRLSTRSVSTTFRADLERNQFEEM